MLLAKQIAGVGVALIAHRDTPPRVLFSVQARSRAAVATQAQQALFKAKPKIHVLACMMLAVSVSRPRDGASDATCARIAAQSGRENITSSDQVMRLVFEEVGWGGCMCRQLLRSSSQS